MATSEITASGVTPRRSSFVSAIPWFAVYAAVLCAIIASVAGPSMSRQRSVGAENPCGTALFPTQTQPNTATCEHLLEPTRTIALTLLGLATALLTASVVIWTVRLLRQRPGTSSRLAAKRLLGQGLRANALVIGGAGLATGAFSRLVISESHTNCGSALAHRWSLGSSLISECESAYYQPQQTIAYVLIASAALLGIAGGVLIAATNPERQPTAKGLNNGVHQ